LHLLAAPADAVEAMEVDDTLMAQVITLARRSYDYVILDTFPLFDRVVVAVLDLSDRAYIVVENVVPTLLGAVKLLDVLERIGFPAERQCIVVNRHQRVAGNLAATDIAVRLERQIDHVLPFDKRVIAAANSGQPILGKLLPFGGFARGLQRLVAEVESLAGREHGRRSIDQRSVRNGNGELDNVIPLTARSAADGAERTEGAQRPAARNARAAEHLP
jgi:pilus assembly protein CpaE